jgi:hypothetical protein
MRYLKTPRTKARNRRGRRGEAAAAAAATLSGRGEGRRAAAAHSEVVTDARLLVLQTYGGDAQAGWRCYTAPCWPGRLPCLIVRDYTTPPPDRHRHGDPHRPAIPPLARGHGGRRGCTPRLY